MILKLLIVIKMYCPPFIQLTVFLLSFFALAHPEHFFKTLNSGHCMKSLQCNDYEWLQNARRTVQFGLLYNWHSLAFLTFQACRHGYEIDTQEVWQQMGGKIGTLKQKKGIRLKYERGSDCLIKNCQSHICRFFACVRCCLNNPATCENSRGCHHADTWGRTCWETFVHRHCGRGWSRCVLFVYTHWILANRCPVNI